MPDDPEWVSASDLAEYAYCPRALYYRRLSPDAPPTEAARGGTRYHDRRLRAELRRARPAWGSWAAVAAGAALLTLALLALGRP